METNEETFEKLVKWSRTCSLAYKVDAMKELGETPSISTLRETFGDKVVDNWAIHSYQKYRKRILAEAEQKTSVKDINSFLKTLTAPEIEALKKQIVKTITED